MAVSVGAQEERISELSQQLQDAQRSQPGGGGAQVTDEEREEMTRRAAAAEAEKRRLQQELATANREKAARAAEFEKLKTLLVETKQRARAAQAQAGKAGGEGASTQQSPQQLRAEQQKEQRQQQAQQQMEAKMTTQEARISELSQQLQQAQRTGSQSPQSAGGVSQSPQQQRAQQQKEQRQLQAQKEMGTKLQQSQTELRQMQQRNTELQSEVQQATAAAQAAVAEAEASRAAANSLSDATRQRASAASPSMRSPPGLGLRHALRQQPMPGHASPLAHLAHGQAPSPVPQSTWGPTAAAVAAVVQDDGHGWESRESAKESIDTWFEHAVDVIGSAVHVTTREERKEWGALASDLAKWMQAVTARTFTKVGSDEELAALAAATHVSLQIPAGPQLTRPDVLKIVDTLGKVRRLLDRLSGREQELRVWARAERDGGEQARTMLAGVLFHALDIVHASVLVTPQTQRVRLAESIMEQLTRVENGLVNAISAMDDGELMVLTKLLLEIEYFELVRLRCLLPRFAQANLTFEARLLVCFCSWKRSLRQSLHGSRSCWRRWTAPGMPTTRTEHSRLSCATSRRSGARGSGSRR